MQSEGYAECVLGGGREFGRPLPRGATAAGLARDVSEIDATGPRLEPRPFHAIPLTPPPAFGRWARYLARNGASMRPRARRRCAPAGQSNRDSDCRKKKRRTTGRRSVSSRLLETPTTTDHRELAVFLRHQAARIGAGSKSPGPPTGFHTLWYSGSRDVAYCVFELGNCRRGWRCRLSAAIWRPNASDRQT